MKFMSCLLNVGSSRKGEEASVVTESSLKLAEDAGKFWSRSMSDECTQDLSHWVGKGRWSDSKNWYAIGNKHYKMFEAACVLTDKKPRKSMLEWGPGGGANAVCFSQYFDEYFGVDISDANLTECKRQLEKQGFHNFHPILITSEKPEDCAQFIPNTIDFFLSTAVYQHFPGKDYGVTVTALAYKLLSADGLAIIQTRYDDGTKMFRTKDSNYFNNVITFTSYRIEEFWEIACLCGFKPLMVNLEPGTHYAYYVLVKE